MVLINIAICLFISFAAACLAHFLDFCFGEPDGERYVKGRIFTFYGKWVCRVHQWHERRNLTALDPSKALGLCPPCFTSWVAVFCSIFATLVFGMPWYFIFLCIPISVRIIRFWM